MKKLNIVYPIDSQVCADHLGAKKATPTKVVQMEPWISSSIIYQVNTGEDNERK